jgi:hypothetical protein
MLRQNFEPIRWLPTEVETEVLLSFDRIANCGSSRVELDASGRWFASTDKEATSTVHRSPTSRDETFEHEVVALSAVSAVRHDTEPESVAWISWSGPTAALQFSAREAALVAPAPWCDAHHITHRADGGITTLINLMLLCRRHHVAVREGKHPPGR